MIDELAELLRRQCTALEHLEQRLRALELVVASDEQRFVALALEELEKASEQLAGLELARVLAISTAGLSLEASGSELVATIGEERAAPLAGAIHELREAMRRTTDARARAIAVVSRSGGDARARLAAASAFSSVG